MKTLLSFGFILLLNTFGIAQGLNLNKENYSRKNIRSFNALTNEQKKTTLIIVNAQLEWIENGKTKSIVPVGVFSQDQISQAQKYSDLGILPSLNETTYYSIDNSSKLLVVPSIIRKEIEIKSAINTK